jgi:hypothetical protein
LVKRKTRREEIPKKAGTFHDSAIIPKTKNERKMIKYETKEPSLFPPSGIYK